MNMKEIIKEFDNLCKEFDICEDFTDLISYGFALSKDEFEDFIRLLLVFTDYKSEREKLIKLAIKLKIENLPIGVLKEYGTKYTD